MTPEPKYFAMKKATGGTCMRFDLPYNRESIPSIDPNPITKMEETRIPKRPSYSFPLSQDTSAKGGTVDMIV
ncbi:hypothetical protein WAI453_008526 [Rhynchosporium graminicola]